MNCIFTACVACKNSIQTRKKNPVHQTRYFKLENIKTLTLIPSNSPLINIFLSIGQRYCVNSSSLDFVPEIDEADGKVKVEETEYIKHEATLGGKCINTK